MPDLAVANGGSSTVSVLLGNGDGTFGTKSDFGTGSASSSVAIGDVNADLKPDLAVAGDGTFTVSVLLGNGDGTFGAKADYGTGKRPESVAIGDVNGDFKPDLATANILSNTVSVLLNIGPQGPLSGACCHPDGSCTITMQLDCPSPGIWQGAGTDCEPNPCLQCQVMVTAPNGGESWPVGSQQVITWNRTDNCDDVVKIELLRRMPGPSSGSAIYRSCATIAAAAPNTGSYAWVVERCGIGADQYKIQVTDVAAVASDRSDGSFSIPSEKMFAARPPEQEGFTLPVPFRPGSPIRFGLRESGPVRVTICDVLGRRIRTIVDGPLPAGDQEMRWDAKTDGGVDATSGIYYLEINHGHRQMKGKLLMIR